MDRRNKKTELAVHSIVRRPESVPRLRETVDDVAGRLGFSPSARCEIALAVAEACNNAVLYGAENELMVRCVLCGDYLDIEIQNRGAAFSPTAPAKMPDVTAEHGRGRALMEGMVDAVAYERDASGTTVRLRKRLPGP